MSSELIAASIIELIIILLFLYILKIAKQETIEEKRMRKRLENPFLYDPESGEEFTFDQINLPRMTSCGQNTPVLTDREIEMYYDENQIPGVQISNLLKTKYKFETLSEKNLTFLESSVSVKNYDDWSYSNSFNIDIQKKVLFPTIRSIDKTGFSEQEFIFWIKTDNVFGHYYLRPKEIAEKIFDFFRNDDAFEIGEFEIFTYRASRYIKKCADLLSPFKDLKYIEIELIDDNLLIKIFDSPSIEKFEEVVEIVNAC